ncbi:uncharacterized protein I303_100268 [Kwoniella dejecticola CBS 10117]|uniref:Uncharacterized protein n=1 Tax=Kwoniella dejecticola CBS 10117 TaxID=1296121 RepID=A0A1A6AEF1_9TREE|nr:uncharacterized protein I303_00269 [Kwoniella dejecticola CBS 10117]OBR88452.1 hypothetical protein I303_00269 [Kwoniella dejecticola CBS 10117]
MTTQWACPDLPSEGTDSRCCFADATCAEYVCGQYNANITVQTTGSLVMHNCLVPNGTEATNLYMTSPGNESCSANSQGNGCIIRLDTNGTATTTTATSAGMSMSSGSPALTSSSPASASASAGSGGGSSFATPQFGINQTLILAIVGLSWLVKKVYH